MRSGNIAIITHVNPFASGSGQIQRVYNTLLAIAADWDTITVYTLAHDLERKEKVQQLLAVNPSLRVVYLKQPRMLNLLKPAFHLLPYLGFGKPSNWIIPFIFRQLDVNLFSSCNCVLFEYWHLYKLAVKIKSRNIKVVCDTHNILLGSFKEYIAKKKLPASYKRYLVNSYRRLEFKKALGSFNALIAINKEEEAIYKKEFPANQIIYCPMGVKLAKSSFLQHSNGAGKYFTVVYYGGLGNPRNSRAALEVYSALFESSTLAKLPLIYKILGSDPPRQLTDLSLANSSVKVPGFVEDLSTALSGVDLAVIPFEGKYGFRSRLIELMYYGIPVLTTRDAVWGMGFNSGTDIFIYEPGDNLQEIIIELLNDTDKRKLVSQNAKAKVEKEFTFETTYGKLSGELKKMTA
ncbi:MAG: glycosyltransferase family 4 protein [Ginsengibacter sp.]